MAPPSYRARLVIVPLTLLWLAACSSNGDDPVPQSIPEVDLDAVTLLVAPFDEDVAVTAIDVAGGLYAYAEGARDGLGRITSVERIVILEGDREAILWLGEDGLISRAEFDAGDGTLPVAAQIEYGLTDVTVHIFDPAALPEPTAVQSIPVDDVPGLREALAVSRHAPGRERPTQSNISLAQNQCSDEGARCVDLMVTVTGLPEGPIEGATLHWRLSPPSDGAAVSRYARRSRQGVMPATDEPGVYRAEIPVTSPLTPDEVRRRCGSDADFWNNASLGIGVIGGIASALAISPVGGVVIAAAGVATALTAGSHGGCEQLGETAAGELDEPWTAEAFVVGTSREQHAGASPSPHPDIGRSVSVEFTSSALAATSPLPLSSSIDLGELLTASISGPARVPVGQPVEFAVTVESGSGVYGYHWLPPVRRPIAVTGSRIVSMNAQTGSPRSTAVLEFAEVDTSYVVAVYVTEQRSSGPAHWANWVFFVRMTVVTSEAGVQERLDAPLPGCPERIGASVLRAGVDNPRVRGAPGRSQDWECLYAHPDYQGAEFHLGSASVLISIVQPPDDPVDAPALCTAFAGVEYAHSESTRDRDGSTAFSVRMGHPTRVLSGIVTWNDRVGLSQTEADAWLVAILDEFEPFALSC